MAAAGGYDAKEELEEGPASATVDPGTASSRNDAVKEKGEGIGAKVRGF
jgi:hypothetical protein